MQSVFTTEFTVEKNHTDPRGYTKLSTLLYFAQEAAGSHCRLLGTDWDTLAKKDLFWAVLRYQVQIRQLPALGQTVTLRTWPMPTTRSAYPRATEICDADGNVLVRTIALWVLMNKKTRTMVLPGKSGVTVEGVLLGSELPTPGSLAPGEWAHTCTCHVDRELLDRNGHMNNTRYLDWIQALLEEGQPVKAFTVCYLSEVLPEQEIRIRWQLSPEGIFRADGLRQREDTGEKPERVFAAEVLF